MDVQENKEMPKEVSRWADFEDFYFFGLQNLNGWPFDFIAENWKVAENIKDGKRFSQLFDYCFFLLQITSKNGGFELPVLFREVEMFFNNNKVTKNAIKWFIKLLKIYS